MNKSKITFLAALLVLFTAPKAWEECAMDGVPLFCEWPYSNGCYPISTDPVYEPRDCHQLIEECSNGGGALYSGATGIGPENKFGEDLTCYGQGGTFIAGTKAEAPVIIDASLHSSIAGEHYYGWIYATELAVWSVEGNLPLGLKVENTWGYKSEAYISGYPTTPGIYNFTVKAINSGGSDTREFSITINPERQKPIIYDNLRKDGVVDDSYYGSINSNRAAYWSIVNGSLPPGLDVDVSEYKSQISIYGTPIEIGNFTFTVRAENTVGFSEQAFTMSIAGPGVPKITTIELPNGKVDRSYETKYFVSDRTATWSVVGTLPPGLHMQDGNYAYIYGTPTVPGTYDVTIKAENSYGSTTKNFTIKIVMANMPIIDAYMPDGKLGQWYSASVYSDIPVKWSIIGTLPDGLELQDYCKNYGNYICIEGDLTKLGEFTFTVRATNNNYFAEETFTVKVVMPDAPEITTISLPSGSEGEHYRGELEATDYAEWSIVGGNLPPGLNLYDGYISGYPTTAGEYKFTVKATNVTSYDTKEFTIAIGEALYAPRFECVNSPSGVINRYYLTRICSDRAAYWSIVNGSLPPGLDVNMSEYESGIFIYGKPTAIGDFTFTIMVSNSAGSNTETITISIIAPPPPEIVFANIPDGVVGKSYSGHFEATDYVSWSVIEGNLPPGLVLLSHSKIEGKPTTAGEYTFKVKAENTEGHDEQFFTIKIVMPSIPVITTVDLPNGIVGKYYGELLEAITDYAEWSRVSGTLPPGFSLSYSLESGREPSSSSEAWVSSSGAWVSSSGGSPSSSSSAVSTNKMYIEGTPRTAGTYNFTIKATNAAGSDIKDFSITIDAEQQKPEITYNNLHDGIAGISYWGYIYSDRAANWSIEGNLPPGLILENANFSSEARISGTPTTSGEYTFSIKAINSKGSDSKTFIINIAIPPVPIIENYLQDGIVGAEYYGYIYSYYCSYYYHQYYDYCQDLPANWSITEGSLPPGIKLNSTSFSSHLEFYGTPTTAGEYTFTIKAENAGGGEEEKTFTITIVMPRAPEILTSVLPDEMAGEYYSERLEATDYAQWSVISGSLPPGLELNYGYIGGYPKSAGTYNFTVRATNASGSDTKALSITIVAEQYIPVIVYENIYNSSTVGADYEAWIYSDRAAYWSIEGSLPPGLELESDFERHNYIYGIPTTPGTYTFTVKVTNSVGFDSKEFTITIADEYLPPEISEYEIYEGETGDKYEGYIYSDRAASWSVVAGSLPPGLEFESVFSRVLHISGVPTTPGEYTFTVRATNSVGFDEKSFTIKITGEALPPDLAAECLAAGKVWENDQCTIPTVTILPQFAASKIRAYAAGKTIVLENVPAGAKAEVYNIQGKRIYSANPDNPLILKIGVQTGVYIVRVSFGSEKQILRVPVR